MILGNLHTTKSPDLDPRTKPLFERYLSAVGATEETLTKEETAHAFYKAVVVDFLTYRISSDELSLMMSKLWWALNGDPAMKHGKRIDACNSGTEIEWYLRNDPQGAAGFLLDVIKYYEEIGGEVPEQPEGSRYPEVNLE
jgi:hypothetical protein